MTEQLWIALMSLVGIVVGAGIGSIGVFLSRRKIQAEAADLVTQAALSLVKPLEERVTKLSKEVDGLRLDLEHERETSRLYRKTLDDWREGFEELDCQMRENDITPRWKPSPIPPRQPRDKPPDK